MTALDSVTRFQDSLKRVMGLKGNLPVTAVSPVMIATSPTHDPLQGEMRILRGERLWGIGATFVQGSTQSGAGLAVGVGATGAASVASNTVTVVTHVVLSCFSPTPPAGTSDFSMALFPYSTALTTPANPADGRVVAIATRYVVLNSIGFLATPLVAEFSDPSTVQHRFEWNGNVVVTPGFQLEVAFGFSANFTVNANYAWGIQGYERTLDPSEKLADGNVI